MIIKNGNIFHLSTKDTSLLLRLDVNGHLLTEYYGGRLKEHSDYRFSEEKFAFPLGGAVNFEKDHFELSLDHECLEVSTSGKGDFREPSIIIQSDKGYVFDFTFVTFQILKGPYKLSSLPTPHDFDEMLVITLADQVRNIELDLRYLVFENGNIIARNATLKNQSHEELVLDKIMSLQMDLLNQDFKLMNLYGSWASENNQSYKPIEPGIFINDSKTGSSGNRHNPFFMLLEKDATLENGNVYGFNLIYSGNHYELVELTTFDKLRVQVGINPFLFHYHLKPNEGFVTPFAVMSFSSLGQNGVSQNFHYFINHHIVRGPWALKPRPILINNWEATYFNFTEEKLGELLHSAKDLGIELLVLDDGWFGSRNNDHQGLGDYSINKKKLPHGLAKLSKRVNAAGLKFGLWFEPEMVNEISELFTTHPEWVIKIPDRSPSYGRNQLVLDLGLVEVQDYIIENVSKILTSAHIEYVKWDMNRHMSDFYSSRYNQGELFHRYMLGLYRVFDALTSKFDDILWEGCSSGGNRFDLGILSYFQQIWTSDDTDAYQRISIQSGASLGYPLSAMGCHVAGSPSHQLLRNIPIETRFNVASMGNLGYELDLKKLTPLEEKEVKNQIAFYKDHRTLFQYGIFYQLKNLDHDGYAMWMVISQEKDEAIVGYYQGLGKITPSVDILKVPGLIKDALYEVTPRHQEHNIKAFGSLINMVSPIPLNENGGFVNFFSKRFSIEQLMKMKSEEKYQAFGDAFENGAIKLLPQWAGNGFSEKVRLLGDFGSQLYYIKKI